MSTEGGETEFSAGGVVVRGGEVVVIVPTKRGPNGERVLGLPKGHPEPGESALEAAVREVREEAGVSGRLIGSLGSIRYERARRGRLIPKRVEFFLFEYESGDPQDHDHEIEEAVWMPLSAAAVSLTFEGERQILQRAMSKCPGDL